MSKNLRPVRVEWGPCSGTLLSEDQFADLLELVTGDLTVLFYGRSKTDKVCKFWLQEGAQFLDHVRDCNPELTVKDMDESYRQDALSCLQNLQALEPQWRSFIDEHDHLEIWQDVY